MQVVHDTPSHFDAEFQELERQISSAPKAASVKGMYLDSFMKLLDHENVPRPTRSRFVAFRDYPLQEFMTYLLHASKRVYPDSSPKDGLRRLGQLAYPTFANSTVGRVIFSLAGRSWEAALPLTSRAYEVSLKPGKANLSHLSKTSAIIELREIWNFPDSYQVGVFEGAMQTFNVQGTVRAVPQGGPSNVDLMLDWTA